jgi:two-component system copper resistance phosphate regulon response regulator CusR
MRILIAEDDVPLCRLLQEGLESEQYTIDISHRGDEAFTKIGTAEYDLLLLDLTLPGIDGMALLKRAKILRPSLPVLILTGRNEVEDRVECLDHGADDFLAKPFSFLELSARIRALLRRSHLPSEAVLTVGDLKLDRVERRVERAGKRIELTSKEFSLLEYLMCNAGRKVTRDMIIEHVWNLNLSTATTNVVDVYINYLRRKIEDDPARQLIHTLRGIGYEISSPEQGTRCHQRAS